MAIFLSPFPMALDRRSTTVLSVEELEDRNLLDAVPATVIPEPLLSTPLVQQWNESHDSRGS